MSSNVLVHAISVAVIFHVLPLCATCSKREDPMTDMRPAFISNLARVEYRYHPVVEDDHDQVLVADSKLTLDAIVQALSTADLAWHSFDPETEAFLHSREELLTLHYDGDKPSRELVILSPEDWIYIDEELGQHATFRGKELATALREVRAHGRPPE